MNLIVTKLMKEVSIMRVKSLVVVLLSAMMMFSGVVLSDPGNAAAAPSKNIVIAGKADGVYTIPPAVPVFFFDADLTLTLTPIGTAVLPQSYTGAVQILNGFLDQADTLPATLNFSDSIVDPLYIGYSLNSKTFSVGILRATLPLFNYGFFVTPQTGVQVPLNGPFDILDIPLAVGTTAALSGPITQVLATWVFADTNGVAFGTPMAVSDLQIFGMTDVGVTGPASYLRAATTWDLTHPY
jgi:hypothetical protein